MAINTMASPVPNTRYSTVRRFRLFRRCRCLPRLKSVNSILRCSGSNTSAHQILCPPAQKLMYCTCCMYCPAHTCLLYTILVNLTKFCHRNLISWRNFVKIRSLKPSRNRRRNSCTVIPQLKLLFVKLPFST